MNVLVACEFSGIVRDAFIARGHNAWSCDVLPTERPGPHLLKDVGTVLASGIGRRRWDLVIAHPPCTFLCNSGVRWLYEQRGRWERLRRAANFFRQLLNAPAPRVAVENPIPHKYAVDAIGRKYDQLIQPWQFGHGESKALCLWLRGVPLLQPTNIVPERKQRVWREAPGKDRWKNRSRFYPGIADAMAHQWGRL